MAAASSRGSTGSASTPRWTRSGPASAGRSSPIPKLDDESWQPPAGVEADPERTALDTERTRALAAPLAEITDDQRAAIVLYDVEGYDYAEIAEMTGVSLGTVKSRIHRGRLALARPARRPDGAVPWLTCAAPGHPPTTIRSSSRASLDDADGRVERETGPGRSSILPDVRGAPSPTFWRSSGATASQPTPTRPRDFRPDAPPTRARLREEPVAPPPVWRV